MFCRLSIAAALVAACGSSGPSVDATSFKQLERDIHEGDSWNASVIAIEKVLGPAKTKGEHRWTWAVATGNDCFDLQVVKNGDSVGGFGGSHVSKLVPDLYAKCAERAR